MRPGGDATPGLVLDLAVVGQIPNLQLLIEGKRDAGVGSAVEVALATSKELRRAGEELLNVILAQGRHDAWPET